MFVGWLGSVVWFLLRGLSCSCRQMAAGAAVTEGAARPTHPVGWQVKLAASRPLSCGTEKNTPRRALYAPWTSPTWGWVVRRNTQGWGGQRREAETIGSSHLALEVLAYHFHHTLLIGQLKPDSRGEGFIPPLDGEASRPHYRRPCQAGGLACPTLENAICHNMETYGINPNNRMHI